MIVQTRKTYGEGHGYDCSPARVSASVRIGRVTDAPSWWWADLGGLPAPRPVLDGDREADVCIVGAGYTGLWSAYELLRADPSLAVVVLEREMAGFGASGRNGGWVLGEISTGSRQREAAGDGRDRGARARGPGDGGRGRRDLEPRASTATSSRVAR